MLILTVLIILWLICPLVAATVAADKGRSGCGWFLLGAIFGPLTVLAAAVMSPDYRILDRRDEEKRQRSIARRTLFARMQSTIFGDDEGVGDRHLPKELDDKLKRWVIIVFVAAIAIFAIATYRPA